MNLTLFKKEKAWPSLWEDVDPFTDDINRLTEAFEGLWPKTTQAFLQTAGRPTLDVTDKGEFFEVRADIPGMKKEEIKIELSGSILSIEGSREEKKEEKENGKMRQERFQGYFCRRVDLGEGVQTEAVEAQYTNGVLSLKIPKAEPEKSKVKKITIK